MRLSLLLFTLCSLAAAEPLECDFTDYRWSEDLQAEEVDGDIVVSWSGGPVMWVRATFGMSPVGTTRLRARFGLDAGAPVIRDLAMVDSTGEWVSAVRDARPGFVMAEWVRQTAEQSRYPITNARSASVEITRGAAAFSFKSCWIRGGFENLEVSLNELTVGSFRGSLEFSVRRGSDQLRQEAVVSSTRPLVGVAYHAGLVGLGRSDFTAVRWIDVTDRGRVNRYFGGNSDANESDVLHGDLGELASERGVSLSVILPTEANPPALHDPAIGERRWFLRMPEGRFNVGVHSRRSREAQSSSEDLSDAATERPDGLREPETSDEPGVEASWPHRLGVAYRLDRHWTPPTQLRSPSR